MKQALINRLKIFKVRISLFDKIKLFILSILLVIFKKLNIKLPAVEVQMLPNKNKVFIYDGTDLGTFLEVFLTEEYRVETQKTIKNILDLGANAGYTSLYLADLFKEAKIISVEPDEQSIKKIIKNISTYSNRIIIEPSAVAPKSGKVTFYLNFDTTISGSTIMRDEEAKKVTVPSISLHDLEDKYGPFDLIKFDIEGGEWDSIDPSTLKNIPSIWIGEYHADLTNHPPESFIQRFQNYKVTYRKISQKRFLIIASLVDM